MKIRKWVTKRTLFFTMLCCSWIPIAALVSPFIVNLFHLNFVKPKKIIQQIKDIDQPWPTHAFDNVKEDIHFEPNKKIIYIFGGSSVVLSKTGSFPSNVFSGKLQSMMKNASISNLGKSGADSFYIRKKIDVAISIQKPDLIIIYSGHNDYNNIYRKIIRPNYSILKNTIMSLIIKTSIKFKNSPDWHLDFNFEPRAHRFLSDIGFFEPNPNVFREYDTAAEMHFKNNFFVIAKKCKENKIPLLLITPISNLEIPPISGNEIKLQYNKALQLPYDERIAELIKVRDQDWLSPDARMRTGIKKFIMSSEIKALGIESIDLEDLLIRDYVEFNFSDVYDYFHLTEKTHERIAKILFQRVKEKNIL